MKILEVIIQILFGIILIIGFVFGILYLVKKDENPEWIMSNKEYSILGLFILPVTEIMFLLGIIIDFLINDLSLVPFKTIFVVALPIFMFYAIKIFKENK